MSSIFCKPPTANRKGKNSSMKKIHYKYSPLSKMFKRKYGCVSMKTYQGGKNSEK